MTAPLNILTAVLMVPQFQFTTPLTPDPQSSYIHALCGDCNNAITKANLDAWPNRNPQHQHSRLLL